MSEPVPANGPFRGAMASSAPLLFGATSVCPRCALRFQRRSSCPECGAEDTISLATREGRETYAYRMRRLAAAGTGLAPWSFVVAAVRGLLRLVWGATVLFRALSDKASHYELPAKSATPQLPPAPSRMRVHAPEPADEDVIHGIARAGTIEIESPIGKVPCLAFGLRGSTDRADIADAEGGDFDVELPSGERVLVSLEHAVLVVGEDRAPARPVTQVDVGDALEELLESRGITTTRDVPIPLEEVVLRAGDQVTVSGIKVGASIAISGGGRARVLAGDESRPLSVRIAGV